MFQTVKYWKGRIESEDLVNNPTIVKTIQQLKYGQFKSAQAEFLEGHAPLCTARINQGTRLVYCAVWENGIYTLLILGIHYEHKHDKLFRELATIVRNLKHNILPAEIGDLEDKPLEALLDKEPYEIPSPVLYYHEGFIIPNDEQCEALSAPPTATTIVRGPPGSGKTCLGLEALYKTQDECTINPNLQGLLITPSANLALSLNEEYGNSLHAKMSGADKVFILSYEQLVYLLDPSLKPENKAKPEVFTHWITNYYKLNNGTAVLPRELTHIGKQINIAFFLQTLRLLSGYSRHPDSQIGRQEIFLDTEQTIWFRKALVSLEQHLAVKQVFILDFFRPPLPDLNEKKYRIIVEEGQDFSTQQAKILMDLAGNNGFFLVSDTNQNAWGDFSIYPFIKQYCKDKTNLFHFMLPYSYRCPRNIVDFANCINKLKVQLTGVADKYERTIIPYNEASQEDQDPGIVEILSRKPTTTNYINQYYSNHSDTVIIVPPEYKKEAKNMFNNHAKIFTPEEFKGFESEVVVIYLPFGDKTFKTVCHLLQKLEEREEPLQFNRPNSSQAANRYLRLVLQKLYVSCTRSLKELILIHDENTRFNLAPLLNPLKKVIANQMISRERTRPVASDSKALWKEQFDLLIRNGNDEQAFAIWTRYLDGSLESFEEIKRERENALSARVLNVPTIIPGLNPSTVKSQPIKQKKQAKRKKTKKQQHTNKLITPSLPLITPETHQLLQAIQHIIDKAQAYNYLGQATSVDIGNYPKRLLFQMEQARKKTVESTSSLTVDSQQLIFYYTTQAVTITGLASSKDLAASVLTEASFQGLLGKDIVCKEFTMINRDKSESYFIGIVVGNIFFDVITQQLYPLEKFTGNNGAELYFHSASSQSMKQCAEEVYSQNLILALRTKVDGDLTYPTFNNNDKKPYSIKVNITFPYLYNVFVDTLTKPIYLNNPAIAFRVQNNILRDFIALLDSLRLESSKKNQLNYTNDFIFNQLSKLIPDKSFVQFIQAVSYKYLNPKKFKTDLISLQSYLQADSESLIDQWLIHSIQPLITASSFEAIEDNYIAYQYLRKSNLDDGGYSEFVQNMTNLTFKKICLNHKKNELNLLMPYYSRAALLNNGICLDDDQKAAWMLFEGAEHLLDSKATVEVFEVPDSVKTRAGIQAGNTVYDIINKISIPLEVFKKKYQVINQQTCATYNGADTLKTIQAFYKSCDETYRKTQKDIVLECLTKKTITVSFQDEKQKGAVNVSKAFLFLAGCFANTFNENCLSKNSDVYNHVRGQIINDCVLLYILLTKRYRTEEISVRLTKITKNPVLESAIINVANLALNTGEILLKPVTTIKPTFSQSLDFFKLMREKTQLAEGNSTTMMSWLYHFSGEILTKYSTPKPSTTPLIPKVTSSDKNSSEEIYKSIKEAGDIARAYCYLSGDTSGYSRCVEDSMMHARKIAYQYFDEKNHMPSVLDYVNNIPNLMSRVREFFDEKNQDISSKSNEEDLKLIHNFIGANITIHGLASRSEFCEFVFITRNFNPINALRTNVICQTYGKAGKNRAHTIHKGIQLNDSFYDIHQDVMYPLTDFAGCQPLVLAKKYIHPRKKTLFDLTSNLLSSIFADKIRFEQQEGLSYPTFEAQDSNPKAIHVNLTFPYLYKKFLETFTFPVFTHHVLVANSVRKNILRDFATLVDELRVSSKQCFIYSEEEIQHNLHRLIPNPVFVEFIMALSYVYSDTEKWEKNLKLLLSKLSKNSPDIIEQWLPDIIQQLIMAAYINEKENQFSLYSRLKSSDPEVTKYNNIQKGLAQVSMSNLLQPVNSQFRKQLSPYYAKAIHKINGAPISDAVMCDWMLLQGAERFLPLKATVERIKIGERDEHIGLLIDGVFFDLSRKDVYAISDLKKTYPDDWTQITLGSFKAPDTLETIQKFYPLCEEKVYLEQTKMLKNEMVCNKFNFSFHPENNAVIDAKVIFVYLYHSFEYTFIHSKFIDYPDIVDHLRDRILKDYIQVCCILETKYPIEKMKGFLSNLIPNKLFAKIIIAMITSAMASTAECLKPGGEVYEQCKQIILATNSVAMLSDPKVVWMRQFTSNLCGVAIESFNTPVLSTNPYPFFNNKNSSADSTNNNLPNSSAEKTL